MRTSIATVSLSGDLDEKLNAIAEAGFDGVEIFENDFLSFDGGPREVGRMIRDLGLDCVTFQPFRDFEGMPEPQRKQAFERAERKFEVMRELGTDLLLVCSNISPLALGGIDRAAEDLRALGERAAEHGLRIGFEALAWGRHINDHRDAWEAVRRADHPTVGLVLDSFHTLSRKLPTDSIQAIPKERIFLVQIADAPLVDMDLLFRSRHFRNFPGQGDLPLGGFMDALVATGYDGFLSLEIFNDQFRAGTTRQTAAAGKRSLIYLMDRIDAPGAQHLPPRTPVGDVAFIEFASDEETAGELERFLAALGFAHAGQHKRKSVNLWQQGRINLVINTEKEGFAHSHYIMHGPSVCAVGLEVADAALALDRAEGLLLPSFSQPVAPGELELPAIRGVGGSLLYLFDRKSELANVWDIEFDLSAVTDAGIGLTRVDHVSQSMPHEDMLSWLLTYTALFELEKTTPLEIADPGGVVQSQAVQTADQRVRITLNSSQSPKTQSSRFVDEYFGSGVQHIAFATDDIFAAVRQIEANGVEMLRIPANYYDDLGARLPMDGALLDRLRAHNVLYDRDDGGEYLQIYTRTFANRFFFEVVERRDYNGYGAANAAIRLAAQARSSKDSRP